MIGRGLGLARKALHRSPRFLIRRLGQEIVQQGRRPWDRVRPRLFTDRALLDRTGDESIAALWQRLSGRPFLLNAGHRKAWAAAFRAAFPDGEGAVLTAAEAIVRHEFDLLGSGPTALGPRLPWHADFKTGRVWPLVWSRAIEPNELDRPSDIKVPWELSRCQHFTTLGQAWWLSGRAELAREIVAEVDDWIDRNPYGRGVNWTCPMDVAIRAVNWIWAFHFFADAPELAAEAFRSRWLRSLFLHGEFLAANPERDEVNGNHFLVDAVGLVCLGVFFRGTADADRWRAMGRRMLLAEITAQSHEDGTGIEQSTAYHRLVLEAFLTAGLVLRADGDPLEPAFWTRVERMHELALACVAPDGHTPILGDADDGRIQRLGGQPMNDYRYLLSTGAALFGRGDFKRAAGRFWEESFWLLGPSGLDAYHRVETDARPPRPHAFPDAGVYVLRHDAAHVVVDCGEVGLKGLGGHGHNDILSFELALDGISLLTDSGSYLYTASRDWRNRFRSTAYHNTLEVDGEELNRFVHPDELWRLRYDAVPRDVSWRPDGTWQSIRAGHRGYERLPHPVTHWRTVLLHADRPWVLIADDVAGEDRHRLTWRFHVAPSVFVDVAGETVRLSAGGRDYELALLSATAPVAFAIEEGWYAPRYGRKIERAVVVARTDAAMPFQAVWSIHRGTLDSADRMAGLVVAKERT